MIHRQRLYFKDQGSKIQPDKIQCILSLPFLTKAKSYMQLSKLNPT